jgi:excisionase family DNA binding protein
MPADVYRAPTMGVAEVARYLGVGRKVVYQLIETGVLECRRDRGAVRCDAASVAAFRESGQLT